MNKFPVLELVFYSDEEEVSLNFLDAQSHNKVWKGGA